MRTGYSVSDHAERVALHVTSQMPEFWLRILCNAVFLHVHTSHDSNCAFRISERFVNIKSETSIIGGSIWLSAKPDWFVASISTWSQQDYVSCPLRSQTYKMQFSWKDAMKKISDLWLSGNAHDELIDALWISSYHTKYFQLASVWQTFGSCSNHSSLRHVFEILWSLSFENSFPWHNVQQNEKSCSDRT